MIHLPIHTKHHQHVGASSFYFVFHFLALPVVLTIKHKLIPQKMQLDTLINF